RDDVGVRVPELDAAAAAAGLQRVLLPAQPEVHRQLRRDLPRVANVGSELQIEGRHLLPLQALADLLRGAEQEGGIGVELAVRLAQQRRGAAVEVESAARAAADLRLPVVEV